MAAMQINFVTHTQADKWQDLLAGRPFDADSQPSRFRSGVDVWVAQTYLLAGSVLERDMGVAVHFTDRFVPGQICIAHRDDLNSFRVPFFASYVIGVRADRPPIPTANGVVVQNGLDDGVDRQRFIPLWPQPGLVRRAAQRGNVIRRIGYLGRASSAPGWFADPGFHAALAALGVEFVIREKEWHDYSDLDLVLAYRNEAPAMLAHKPATKLYNAWLAEVPALLGAEPAYREAFSSPLDFIEIATPQDVVAAVGELKAHPDRYGQMVENGRQRGTEYNVAAIQQRWLRYLRDEILPDYERWQAICAGTSSLVRASRFHLSLLRQKLASERFKAQLDRELRAMKQDTKFGPAPSG